MQARLSLTFVALLLATTACVISNNTCMNNGGGISATTIGSNIQVDGSDNRIEGNNCVGADYGIYAGTGSNIILGNSCSGNSTNWRIGAGNVYATIVDRTAPGGALISGDSAPGTLGTTEPNANITY